MPLIALQLVKSQANLHYDTLQNAPSWAAALPQLIADHPEVAHGRFATGLLVELGAFTGADRTESGVPGGRERVITAMHLFSRWALDLAFPAHEGLLLVFLINPPWLAWEAARHFCRPSGTGLETRGREISGKRPSLDSPANSEKKPARR